MKRFLILFMAICILACSAGASFAKRIVFANEGLGNVYAIYLYHAQSNHSSANLVQGNTLYQGYGATVDLNPLNGWDVIVDTSSGQRLTWDNVDFSNVNIMFLFPDRAEYQ